ncbi:MAG: glycoside hydrolase family 127 protein [Acidobacteriaceae bacterium]|nr:glycoside hydrolase family 127 protein [Acidobacteriaceae bacterium]MBV9781640.1 glycoside hydrolase family 127 protein [Acidobacteriaceae bacterium]
MKRASFFIVVAVIIPLLVFSSQEQNDRSKNHLTADWKNEGVIYLDHSLNARLHTVPISAVHLGDGFWSVRRKVTVERSLPTMLDLLEEHGVVDNFRRLSGRKNVPRKGPLYTDSDLYKWIEAASWAIASNETSDVDRHKLLGQIESLISDIIAAQEPDGYLNTYYVGDKAHLRFTELTRSHEDYCLGHLIQAAIAYYRATGNPTLLNAAIKFADYVVDNFGPTKRPFLTGHPELEMALVELYRTTGEAKYLDFVRYIFSGVERDRLKLKDSEIRYMFSGKPFTSRTEFEGHAVRALYAASGATDYFAEAGDPAFKRTLDLLWTDLTARKMYITGGVGSRASYEGFGDPYDLPSADAYAETCAAVANVMWNFRLLALTGDARYADVLERTLYNGANSGMSLSGTLYCYRNPLATNGEKIRNPWYETTCCPPNIERLLESLPGYFYFISRDGVYVNLYHNSELDWHLEDKTGLKITQATNYPWTGDIKLTVNPERASNFTVYLRWPAWASSADVQVNGQPFQTADLKHGSFIPITRRWSPGDTVALSLPLQPVPTVANPRVADLYGRVAMQRGPLVYALEQMDQGGVSLGDLFIRANGPASAEARKDLLGGVTTLKVSGSAAEKSLGEESLYEPLATALNRSKRPITLTFIPYYAIANREPTPIEVWVPLSRFDVSASSTSGSNGARHAESK